MKYLKRLIIILISLIYFIYLKLTKVKINDSLIILFYHSIINHQIRRFEKQIFYIYKKFNTVNSFFESVNDKSVNHRQLNILVTFDDALTTVKENALPILKRYNVPSIVFVPTGLLGKTPNWEAYDYHFPINDKIMSEEDLLSITKNYDVVLGSHTHSHKNLIEADDIQVFYELSESKKVLESLTNKSANLISFPYGFHNNEIEEKAIMNGYKFLFTSDPEIIRLNMIKKTCGRIRVDPEDLFVEFILKVNGAYSWKPIVNRWKKILLNLKFL